MGLWLQQDPITPNSKPPTRDGPSCVLRSVLHQDPITPTPQKLTLNDVHCVLSELQQNPIAPNSKRPTCDRVPLHTEVSAATGPLRSELSTTERQ